MLGAAYGVPQQMTDRPGMAGLLLQIILTGSPNRISPREMGAPTLLYRRDREFSKSVRLGVESLPSSLGLAPPSWAEDAEQRDPWGGLHALGLLTFALCAAGTTAAELVMQLVLGRGADACEPACVNESARPKFGRAQGEQGWMHLTSMHAAQCSHL